MNVDLADLSMLLAHHRNHALALLLLAGVCTGCATTANSPCLNDNCIRVSSPLPGTANVNGGAATYSIPIIIPPGRADMQPNLSVDYSSRGGNGLLGMGWSLDGLSAITLCPATYVQDGYAMGTAFKTTDRLCLDGQHLAIMTGSYGDNDSVYRTFMESLVQVRLHGNYLDSTSYFTVTLKNGTKNYYKALATPLHVPNPVAWELTLQIDPSGNTIRYDYIHPSPGEVYLSRILYTGRDLNNHIENGNRIIQFKYGPRPDVNGVWLAGGEFRQTRRLLEIETGMLGAAGKSEFMPSRRYYLKYRTSKSTGRSLLTSVTGCAYDAHGSEHCLIPAVFSWSDKPLVYFTPTRYAYPSEHTAVQPEWRRHSTTARLPHVKIWQDYNGDGRRDLMRMDPGVNPVVNLYLTDARGKIVDNIDISHYLKHAGELLNSGGDSDFLNVGGANLLGESNGKLAFLSWNTGNPDTLRQTPISFNPNTLTGDFSGTGRTDVLQLDRDNSGHDILTLHRNEDSKPGRIEFAPPVALLTLPNRIHSTDAPAYTIRPGGTLNSSGYPAVLVMEQQRIVWIVLFEHDSNNALHCDAVTPEAYGISPQALSQHWHFADINGDGLQDIVYAATDKLGKRTWRYQLNTGTRFAAPMDTGVSDSRDTQLARHSTIVTDVYSDGRDELVYPAKLLANYCIVPVQIKNSQPKTICSDSGLSQLDPAADLGIYEFNIVRFRPNPDGTFTPVMIDDANIIGQANRMVAGDVLGNGLTQFVSPFDAGFSDGWFDSGGKHYVKCPPEFGCGLHISSSVSIGSDYGKNAAPDMMVRADTDTQTSYHWNFYPLADPVHKLYSVPPLGSADRYVGDDMYYFTSSMYVVGDYIERQHANQSEIDLKYGGAVYEAPILAFQGFRWKTEQVRGSSVVSKQWYYQHNPPYSGNLGASWSEFDYEPGDNLADGKPGPHYLDYKLYSVDCQGPPNNQYSIQFHCQDSHSPTFQTRTRRIIEKHQQAFSYSLLSTTTTKYDYDIYGNVLYEGQEVDNQDGNQIKVIEQVYGPPDINTWWLNRLDSKTLWTNTSKAVAGVSPGNQADNSGYSVTDSEFKYNDRRQVTLRVDHDSSAYSIAYVYVYEENPAATDFGELKEIKYIAIRTADKTEALLNTRKFTYTPDGYFISSINDAHDGTTQYTVDPWTGNILSEIASDGKATEYKYNIFGIPQKLH